MQSACVDAERRGVLDVARGALRIVGDVVRLALEWLDVVAPEAFHRQHRARFSGARSAWPRICHAADWCLYKLCGFGTAARALSGFDVGNGKISGGRTFACLLLFFCHLRVVPFQEIL